MKEHKWVVALAIAVGIGLCWAPMLQAAISPNTTVMQGDTLTFSWGGQVYAYNGESGGEFLASDTPSSGSPFTFSTFCADPTQPMNLNTPYTVSNVSTVSTASQKLTPFAQWVYYEFRLGDTASNASAYVPGNATGLYSPSNITYAGVTTSANEFAGAITQAIWSGLTSATNPFAAGYAVPAFASVPALASFTVSDPTIAKIISAWYTDFSNEQSGSGNTADYNAFLLTQPNLLIADLTCDGSPVQNQMVLGINSNPNGGVGTVPEPTTLVIWGVGAGLAGAAALRRRKQPRGRWSEENRQAIFRVIEGKR